MVRHGDRHLKSDPDGPCRRITGGGRDRDALAGSVTESGGRRRDGQSVTGLDRDTRSDCSSRGDNPACRAHEHAGSYAARDADAVGDFAAADGDYRAAGNGLRDRVPAR